MIQNLLQNLCGENFNLCAKVIDAVTLNRVILWGSKYLHSTPDAACDLKLIPVVTLHLTLTFTEQK